MSGEENSSRQAMHSLAASLIRFGRDRDAALAVEFAMVLVPMLGLLGAIFETGIVYFKSQQLQIATQRASRAVLTHSLGSMTYQSFIDNYVCTWQSTGAVAAGTLSKSFDCSKLLVDIADVGTGTDWSSASTSNAFYLAPPSSSATITMPAPGHIAVVRIVYPMPAVTAILTGGILTGITLGKTTSGEVAYSNRWTHLLFGVAAFRVEPT
ncbi:TadE/TadG family type IV pilus assembly protein [Methylosinus sporium]|uniref:Pilus assembly protein TadE n=1 Tax=Methylosinus sporium TaxID=428 RepID=A0A2U1ST21_METSR|nr:TadE/TadG family type IV pilus assembly protein [Methylosinus sporium]PWB94760.1 pilus assembly protein TadE [Methylosinus sporium]